MSKTPVNVAIVGINRWSAAVGLALRDHSSQPKNHIAFQVTGQDAEKSNMDKARHFGAVDAIQNNARHAVNGADIVLVNLPADVLEGVYEYFSPNLKAGAVVLDMSPYKARSLEYARRFFPTRSEERAYWVGVHLVVHSAALFDARLGVECASKDDLHGGEMVIAPDAHCPEEAVKLATDFADILGMRPRFMLPAELDGLTDYTEQLPTLLGLALFATLHSARGSADLLRLINPNFALLLHTLRTLEAGDLLHIWEQNPQDQAQRIDQLIDVLHTLRQSLLHGDDLKQNLKEILLDFARWEQRRESGRWEDTPSTPTAYGSIFGGLVSTKPKT